jgi:hypothetical protein
MSSPAITPKCLARDIGLTRRDGCYVNSQLCQQEIEIARAIVAALGLHYDSHLDQINGRQYPLWRRSQGTHDSLRFRFLVQDCDQRGRVDDHRGRPFLS